MCIISGQVESVATTNIFVAPLEDAERQLTVYSNTVQLSEDRGVMVLPFPHPVGRPTRSNPHGGQIGLEFVDLSAYPDLFEDLKAVTLDLAPMKLGKSMSRGFSLERLAVVDVGSYKACVVPSVDDFKRLDHSEFPLKPEVFEFLAQQYAKGWGFVVCRLQQSKAYHPFGYTHFIPYNGRHMFIPTVHFHHHADSDDTETDWDHNIYVFNAKLVLGGISSKIHINHVADMVLNKLNLSKLPKLESFKSMAGYRISNYKQNHDLFTCQ